MSEALGPVGRYAADYDSLATVILLALALGSTRIKQPARRLAWAGPTPWLASRRSRCSTTATTDRAGRFAIGEIGRERIATLLIGGPGIATTCEYAATRSMPPQEYPDWLRQASSHDVTSLGNGFDLIAGPDLVAIGMVTVADTGKPQTRIAGA